MTSTMSPGNREPDQPNVTAFAALSIATLVTEMPLPLIWTSKAPAGGGDAASNAVSKCIVKKFSPM